MVRGIGSLLKFQPSSPKDLVIGDHVYFWNHPAYWIINKNKKYPWLLENAVLVDRYKGADCFLGHGSTRSEPSMRSILAVFFNIVADRALVLTRRMDNARRRNNRTLLNRASQELNREFLVNETLGLRQIRGTWYISLGRTLRIFDEKGSVQSKDKVKLRKISAKEVPGLRDPKDCSRMYPIRRPAESRF